MSEQRVPDATPKDGAEGVKLEEQVLITTRGCEPLSRFPFDEALIEGV